MLVYYFVPFIVSNRYLLFWVSNGHNSVTVQNRTHVYMNFFHHKHLGNHLLQLCPKVAKHPVYIYHSSMRNSTGIETAILASYWTNYHYSSASDEVQLGSERGETDNFMLFDFTYDLLLLMSPLKGKSSFCSLLTFLTDKAKCMTFNTASGGTK